MVRLRRPAGLESSLGECLFRRDLAAFRQIVTAFDDHRLARLKIGSFDFDPVLVLHAQTGMQHNRFGVADHAQLRSRAEIVHRFDRYRQYVGLFAEP